MIGVSRSDKRGNTACGVWEVKLNVRRGDK
jgi:hypothetical protein